jgi:hypothetical protein
MQASNEKLQSLVQGILEVQPLFSLIDTLVSLFKEDMEGRGIDNVHVYLNVLLFECLQKHEAGSNQIQ